MIYKFKIEIVGSGENISDAWDDAVLGFYQKPEEPPEDYEVSEE